MIGRSSECHKLASSHARETRGPPSPIMLSIGIAPLVWNCDQTVIRWSSDGDRMVIDGMQMDSGRRSDVNQRACFQFAHRIRAFVSTTAPFSIGGRRHRRGRSFTHPAPSPFLDSRLFAARTAKQMCLCHCQWAR